MFDRPRLSDESILTALRDRYGFAATRVEFLGLGHDANAWTFRAWSDGAAPPRRLFLKVRRTIDPVRLRLAGFLAGHGVPEVVGPVRTVDGSLFVDVDGLVLIAYPFVDGVLGMVAGLTDPQWIAYGSFLRRLHDATLPPDLERALPREDFVPRATEAMRELDEGFRTEQRPDTASDAVRRGRGHLGSPSRRYRTTGGRDRRARSDAARSRSRSRPRRLAAVRRLPRRRPHPQRAGDASGRPPGH